MTGRTKDPISRVILKDGRTRWRFRIDVSQPGKPRKQEIHTYDTKKEAQTERARMLAERAHGTVVQRTKITLDELCQRWLDSREDVREITRVGYAYVLRGVREDFGSRPVQDLERWDVESMIKSAQARGVGHRGIQYTLGAVRQVLQYGVQSGLLATNAAAHVKAPRKGHLADTKDLETWTPEQLGQFRQVADQEPLEWAVAWRLTLCGLRRSEVLGLSWGAVDLDRGEITVRAGRVLLGDGRTATDDPKSRASRRTVPVEAIQPGTTAVLRALRTHQTAQRLALGGWPPHGLVVVHDDGQPIRPEMYSDQFHTLAQGAGLPRIRLHYIRHTLATVMHRAGVAPADAAALLGHTLAVHLDTYIPASERGARSAAAALGSAMAGGPVR